MLLLQLVDVAFYAVEGLILAHVILSWLYAARSRPRWIYHPITMWIDDAGRRILRPFRRILDRVGVSRMTQPIDLSPMLALFFLSWVQRQVIMWVFMMMIHTGPR